MTSAANPILTDLAAEYDQLDALLSTIGAAQWQQPSAAAGWTLADVVCHLALTEEAVARTINRPGDGLAAHPEGGDHLEADMAAEVDAAAMDGPAAHARWRAARTASLAALADADPDTPLAWAAAPLKPRTLATTRLAEHWAHALDIAEGLGVVYPDTDRLRHIAWLGHATLPYAFTVAGLAPAPVRAQLTAPDGSTWAFGPPDAPSRITGPAADFCRVGARRRLPQDTALLGTGPAAEDALRLLRNWA